MEDPSQTNFDLSSTQKGYLGGAGLEYRYIPHNIAVSTFMASDTYPEHEDQVLSVTLTTELDPNRKYFI